MPPYPSMPMHTPSHASALEAGSMAYQAITLPNAQKQTASHVHTLAQPPALEAGSMVSALEASASAPPAPLPHPPPASPHGRHVGAASAPHVPVHAAQAAPEAAPDPAHRRQPQSQMLGAGPQPRQPLEGCLPCAGSARGRCTRLPVACPTAYPAPPPGGPAAAAAQTWQAPAYRHACDVSSPCASNQWQWHSRGRTLDSRKAKSACSKEEGSTGAELRSKGEGSTGAELNLWSSKVLREKGHKASEAHETRSYVPAQMRSQAEARDAPSCPYLGTWLPSAYE
eukprot:scaffold155254_cov23-Tisochrysis_lutea.AAC.1